MGMLFGKSGRGQTVRLDGLKHRIPRVPMVPRGVRSPFCHPRSVKMHESLPPAVSCVTPSGLSATTCHVTVPGRDANLPKAKSGSRRGLKYDSLRRCSENAECTEGRDIVMPLGTGIEFPGNPSTRPSRIAAIRWCCGEAFEFPIPYYHYYLRIQTWGFCRT